MIRAAGCVLILMSLTGCHGPGTCTDQLKNGNETGVDCGGGVCNACPNGERCGVDDDCQSKICGRSGCTWTRCADGILNGDETGIDCGGSCPGCRAGQKCGKDDDCDRDVLAGHGRGLCLQGVCTDSCKNGVRDFGETDVDCGGPCVDWELGLCMEGHHCSDSGDCGYLAFCPQLHDRLLCVHGICTRFCNDGIQDYGEPDVDCGGGVGCHGERLCPLCAPGQHCYGSGNCQSGSCVAGICQ